MESYLIKEMQRFNYLMGETNAAYHEAALKLGMADSTMQVLYCTWNGGGSCPISDICKQSGVSKQTINSALRKLEEEGIVYLEASGGRKKKVCLTEQGKALAENTVVRVIEIENGILGSWTKEEVEQYLGLTRKYLTAFRKQIQELE